MRQELIWRGLQVIEKMERETGFEPATSSLGSKTAFESRELRRLRRRTAYTQNQEFTALSQFCSKNCSKHKSRLRRGIPRRQVKPRECVADTRVLTRLKEYLAHLAHICRFLRLLCYDGRK